MLRHEMWCKFPAAIFSSVGILKALKSDSLDHASGLKVVTKRTPTQRRRNCREVSCSAIVDP
jgi:hypothetical protein